MINDKDRFSKFVDFGFRILESSSVFTSRILLLSNIASFLLYNVQTADINVHENSCIIIGHKEKVNI